MCKKSNNTDTSGLNNQGVQTIQKDWTRIFGTILLFVCAIALIATCIFFCVKYSTQHEMQSVEIHIVCDSTGAITKDSQMEIDAIDSLITNQERLLKGRYENYVQQEEEENLFITFGSIIISIIIAICGFFGYRSFTSIEDRVSLNAEGIAKKKLNDEMGIELSCLKKELMTSIDGRFKEEYEKEFKNKIERYTNENFADKVNGKLSQIEDYEKRLETIESRLDDLAVLIRKLQDLGNDYEDDNHGESDLAKERKQRKDHKEGKV